MSGCRLNACEGNRIIQALVQIHLANDMREINLIRPSRMPPTRENVLAPPRSGPMRNSKHL
jgi:hypothetical protein